MRNRVRSLAKPCLWCDRDKKAKFFSAYGRDDGYGYMVSHKYIACENKGCRDNLIREAAGGPIKVLPLDLSMVEVEFMDPIDQDNVKKFIKKMLGL